MPRIFKNMNTKPILFLSIWGTSVAAAFLVGKAIAPSQEASSSAQDTRSTASSSSSQSESLASNGGSTASMASARARLDAAPMVQKGSTVEQMIEDIARSGDAIERNNALLALIDTLSPEQFLSVVDTFRELGITDDRRGEYQILLTAWAKVNPLEAIEYVKENTQGRLARNTILATWAATHPDSAIAWAEENHENKERANPWLVGVIEGISLYDIPRATQLMETLPRSEERGEALRNMVTQLISKDPEDAKNWSATVEDEYLRSGAYAYTAESIADKNPAEAAEWLSEIGDVTALNRVGEDITADWYRESPEEATAWVSSLPPEAMSEAAEGVVSNVVRDNPVEAAEYISQLASTNPEANFDSSIRELVRGSVRKDPELAAVWVGGLTENNDQTRYYHSVLGEWRNQDSEAVTGWIQENQSSLPDSVNRRFLPQANNGNSTPAR